MIQRKDHFHSPSCGPFLSTLGFTLLDTGSQGMHFQSMEAELDELLDKAQSIPQKVLGQARAVRRRNLGIFTPRFPRSPQQLVKSKGIPPKSP